MSILSSPFNYIPHSPGIYLMRDRQAKIIYIGKAKDLRKRVSSYFRKQIHHPKIAVLVSLIQHIDYIPTSSERASLILEQKLIHKIQPIYNTMWKDDKSYPYVKLTYNEDYPKIILTRQKKNDGGKYFGPYPQVQTIKKLLRQFWRNKLFRLRPCKYPFQRNEVEKGLLETKPSLYKKVKSCLYLHTEECPAPCLNKISHEGYMKIVNQAELYFSGKVGTIIQSLQTEMKTASNILNFEKAGQIRDQINALTHMAEKVTAKEIQENQVLVQIHFTQGLTDLQNSLCLSEPPIRIEAFDISNIQGTNPVASMVVFEKGEPLKSDYRKFKIKTVVGPNDFEMMEEVIYRRYRRVSQEKKKFPDLILVDGGKGQLSSALKAIQSLKKKGYSIPKLSLIGLAKKNEEIFLPQKPDPILLEKNSPALHILQHIRDEAHRFAITFHRQLRDKKIII